MFYILLGNLVPKSKMSRVDREERTSESSASPCIRGQPPSRGCAGGGVAITNTDFWMVSNPPALGKQNPGIIKQSRVAFEKTS